jgi:hypothetical protein
MKYLSCGAVYFQGKNTFKFRVTKLANIIKIIIPMFKEAMIQGVKQLDYQDFCIVASLMVEGKHLTPKGLELIRSIKNRMNTKRKFSKF